jgi:hypothetical protein
MEKGLLQSGNTFFPALTGALSSRTAGWYFFDFAPEERVSSVRDYLPAAYFKVK